MSVRVKITRTVMFTHSLCHLDGKNDVATVENRPAGHNESSISSLPPANTTTNIATNHIPLIATLELEVCKDDREAANE